MSVSRFVSVCFACVLVAGAVCACGGNKHTIEVDQRYSMNIVKTPYWFPDEETPLLPVEKDVFDRYGKPQFMRLWWRDDGTFITSSDLAGKDQEIIGQDMNNMKKSWIYPKLNKEVVFSADHQSQTEQPISEALDLICKYGDPSKNRPVEVEGHTRETWIWLEHGKKALIEDGRVLKVSNFSVGTGTGTIISK
ncbi:MAG: hypothetical protein ABFD69_14265 [Candidatus Sumerlaeia bacterium]